MRKIKILQQVLDPSGTGGVSAEYRALEKSELNETFNFIPMILYNCHRGINRKDISFYYKKIKECEPDIIHIRGAAVDGLNAEIAARKYGKAKILLCIHGMYSEMEYLNPIKKWIAKHIIEPKCFKLADGISCVYEGGCNLPQLKKYKNKMVQFIYNRMPDYSGLNRTEERKNARKELKIEDDSIVGIYCGGVSREKGMIYFDNCLKELSTKWNPKLHFIICGEGDYKDVLKKSCLENNIGDKVHFVGNVCNVSHFLLASDFFVMPSLHENHSIAILEALAANLPCIVTEVGGNTESVQNDITGIVVKPRDSAALCQAILRLLDGNERNKFSLNIKKYDYSKFKNDIIDNQLKQAYLEILNE